MNKLLSVVLAIVMLLQTAVLAAPSVVTVGEGTETNEQSMVLELDEEGTSIIDYSKLLQKMETDSDAELFAEHPYPELLDYTYLDSSFDSKAKSKILPKYQAYVLNAIKYHIESSTKDYRVAKNLLQLYNTGQDGTVLFFFDGCSVNLDGATYEFSGYKKNGNRYNTSAVCIVLQLNSYKKPEIVFATADASTMADNVRDAALNGGTDVSITKDGIYNILTTNHKGYAALNLQITTGASLRCPKSGKSYSATATGINIHARSFSSDVITTSTYSSTGCFNVGTHKSINDYTDYNNFIYHVTGVSNARNNSYPSAGVNAGIYKGIAIVDRSNYKTQLATIFGDDTLGYSGSEIASIITEVSTPWNSAISEKSTYTITFNPNGGTSAPASQTFSGTSYITQEIPVKEGYTFLGWSTTNDNTVDHMSGGKLTPTSNMTLYAVWKADSEFVAETSFVYNNNRYEYYPVSLPWNSAKAFCEKQGGSLVSITSDEERDILIEKLGVASSYWIGASDAETEGAWTWASGETFGYTHWADGEPSNSDDGKEDYASTIAGSPTAKWNDVRINLNVNGFVCEYNDAYDSSDSWTEWSEWSETKVEGSAHRKVENKVQYVYYHYILQFSDGKCGAYPIKSAEFNTYLPQFPTTHKDEHTYESDTQLSKKYTLYYGDESYDCYENKHCPNDYDYDNGENASYLYYRGTKTVYRYSDALYTVAYNPNGGTEAPSAQTKIYGLDVTLSSIIPTRAGYTFLGWATSAGGSVEYAAGATYTANSDVTLYAVWKSNAVSVTGVTLNKTSTSLKIGETDSLTATVSPSNAANKNVSWKSSDNSVATVENGLVTAIGEGTATVTVTTDDGNKTASCTVTVTKAEELDPEAKATVTLSNVTGRAGDKVSVIVSLDTDEEINTLGFSDISYNEDVLTFDGFTQYEEIDEMSTLGSYDENKKIVVIALDEAQQFHGRVFAIDFKIKEGAADGRCAIDISPSVKFNHTEYAVNAVSGSITVVSEILGDLNRDEYVDLNDAILLLQYSMFPDDYPIDYKGSVDFTKDGYIDLNDAILLLQYSMFPDDYPIQ